MSTIHIRSRRASNGVSGYVAWGKFSAIVTDCPLREPGDVWFTFADTAAEAEAEIRTEMLESLN